MKITVLGIVLIAIALILGAVQDLNLYNIYGSSSNQWYFYGIITAILVVGIILVAYGALKKKTNVKKEESEKKEKMNK